MPFFIQVITYSNFLQCKAMSPFVVILIFSVSLCAGRTLDEQLALLTRDKRYITYTYNSAIGMFLAFAIPVVSEFEEIPDRDVLFSYNFEANYNLPTNISYYDLTPPERSFFNFNRSTVYGLFERRLNNLNVNGRQCLLRLICDMARTPISHNGLIGRLLHILFMPSTSESEYLVEEEQAEQDGINDFDCSLKYFKCPHSIIDTISYLA
ncbi:uncharacterized protein LOC106669472 [Cimex lectularius]|uniref:Uncharacterized protein n=1 Tax=Cimex lectularius TaxID=79782 RepID=A0A8I6S035_CIMLE|nr:uncharacterized protein LOC106669472 [Cimex lectularius]